MTPFHIKLKSKKIAPLDDVIWLKSKLKTNAQQRHFTKTQNTFPKSHAQTCFLLPALAQTQPPEPILVVQPSVPSLTTPA